MTTYIHTYTRTCMTWYALHMYVYIWVCTHSSLFWITQERKKRTNTTCTHADMHTHTYSHQPVPTLTCIHTHTHTHTHTHEKISDVTILIYISHNHINHKIKSDVNTGRTTCQYVPRGMFVLYPWILASRHAHTYIYSSCMYIPTFIRVFFVCIGYF